jgi:hypothetical protein
MSSEEAVAVLDAIRAALADEPLTRDELGDAVADALGDARLGDAVRGSFGTMPKLAAFRGDVCFAPPAGQKVRFTRPDRWLGDGWEPAPARVAMADVVRRHLAVYGPATRESFARWFGMSSVAQAGKLIAALGDEVGPRSTSTSLRRHARRRRCSPPSTGRGCTGRRAGSRRCCSSTGGSRASGATSARAES